MTTVFPVWSNPYIGLPTLVAAAARTYADEGERALRDSLFALGRLSGSHLVTLRAVPTNAMPSEWGQLCAGLLEVDGFQGAETTPGKREVVVRIPLDPYLDAYRFVAAPATLNEILWSWHRGILATVNPALEMRVDADQWRGDPETVWRFGLSGEPFPPAERRPAEPMVSLALEHQAWTNPLVRMYAILNALISGWGADGERVAIEAYRALGHEMAAYFLEGGIAPAGATAEQWGHVSDQIAEDNGLADHEVLNEGPGRHTTVMPACARYAVALRLMGAPSHVCDIPMNWDNGELDVINPSIAISVPSCAYRGAARCVYRIGPRSAPGDDRPT